MVAAVLFDLFETLITESGIQPTRASHLAATLGLEEHAYRTAWKRQRPRIVLGQVSFVDALTEISQSLVGRADINAIREISRQRIREKAAAYARIADEIAAMVDSLASQGVQLAVVSNGFEEDVLGWAQCSLASRFKCTAFSYAERVAKPDPEIYLRAVRRLGAEPANSVYIGDGADSELAGAERAGLRAARAAWFARAASCQGDWPELRNLEEVLKFVTPQ
jgi:putative hydrolase of the HAD superfamily